MIIMPEGGGWQTPTVLPSGDSCRQQRLAQYPLERRPEGGGARVADSSRS